MKFNPNDDKLSLPSSEDDKESLISESDEDVPVNDPFQQDVSDSDSAPEIVSFKSAQQDVSDSDSAPEIVSFKSAQQDTQLAKKRAAEVIRRQKDDMRKKRKELHLQNLLQKEEKKKKIALKRLPNEILEDLDKLPASSSVLPPAHESSEPEVKEDTNEDSHEKEILEIHGPTMFKCEVLSKESNKRYIPEKAASFKERALYGGRIRREKSTRESMLKDVKQHARAQKLCR